jgi:hypothetical protein
MAWSSVDCESSVSFAKVQESINTNDETHDTSAIRVTILQSHSSADDPNATRYVRTGALRKQSNSQVEVGHVAQNTLPGQNLSNCFMGVTGRADLLVSYISLFFRYVLRPEPDHGNKILAYPARSHPSDSDRAGGPSLENDEYQKIT